MLFSAVLRKSFFRQSKKLQEQQEYPNQQYSIENDLQEHKACLEERNKKPGGLKMMGEKLAPFVGTFQAVQRHN